MGIVDAGQGVMSRKLVNRPGRRILAVGLLLLQAAGVRAQEPVKPPEEGGALERFEFLQIRMAIPVRITLYAPDEPTANRASDRAYARFKELDRCMSDFDPDSELSRLCRDAVPGHPLPVSDDLFQVLTASADISRQSEGAFDVTVGPLTQLWRKVRRRGEFPPPDELQTARSKVGWQQIRLDPHRQTVEFGTRGMRLDLGGIAKGYAADEALEAMAAVGITSALIDAGGDVVAGDPPPGEAFWRIGIAPLESPAGRPNRFVQLANGAVATSGDASQHVEINGTRYSHIVDPQTGIGLTSLSSVTVLAPTGLAADSLASAVSVLGPQRGLELIEAIDGAEAYVVTGDGDDVPQVNVSAGFERFIAPRRE